MTSKTTTAPAPLAAGDSFHVLLDGLTLGGQTCMRGITYTLVEEWRADTVDRLGHSVFDMIDSEEEQVRRFGQLVFARGEWPEEESIYLDNARRMALDRIRELELANAIEDEEHRRVRLYMIEKSFPTSDPNFGTIDHQGIFHHG